MPRETRIRDLIPNIFSCLPVESLVRFKCLNKECNEIISNRRFIAGHVARTPPKVHGLFCFAHSNPGEVVYIPLYSQQKPNYFTAFPSSIETSCNGLFLHVPSETPESFTVFNPTTKKFRLIPRPTTCYPLRYDSHNLGLAYDPILFFRHDFKVVHIFVVDLDEQRGNQVYGFEIFSSTLNSWKRSKTRLRCATIGETYRAEAVYLGGSLHWIRRCGNIVAFDVRAELARAIPMPDKLVLTITMMESQENKKPWFGVAKGLIYVVYLSISELVFWVLHDYDNCKWGCVRINVASLSSRNNLYVIFFDGEWVVFRRKKGGRVIYMYNIKSNESKKIEARQQQQQQKQTCSGDEENDDVYIPFIPTIAEMNSASPTADDHSIIPVQLARSPNSRRGQAKKRKIVQ